jgi:two-component system response regulator FixJ
MKGDRIVHLIDDDAGVRDSLTFSLASAGLAVRPYESAVAFLEHLEDAPRGCVVSDIRMPGIDGLQLQQRLNKLAVDLPMILMTGHGDVRLAVEAMRAGAIDFIEKPFDDEILLSAIRLAFDRSEKQGRKQAEAAAIRAKLASLTGRERDVLEGLVAGNANKTIARDLNISPRTVEIYRANVMLKTAAGSLSDLVRMALIAAAAASD